MRVKICGIRTTADARMAIEAGADLLGFNLIPTSSRYLPASEVAALVRALRTEAPKVSSRVELVGVVADLPSPRLRELLLETGVDCLQLHGDEPLTTVLGLGEAVFKAVRIGGPEDVELARGYPGRLLLDAKVEGVLGGSGRRFDWSWVEELARERQVLLAGGLNPDNVAEAVRRVRPYAVDVASGVETSPGVKDANRVALFVERAKSA